MPLCEVCFFFFCFKCEKASSSRVESETHPVQVRVRVLGHVVIEDDVDPLDIHPSAEQVCGH